MMLSTLQDELSDRMTAWRHHLHARPELKFEEFETSDFIAETLTALGVPFERGLAGTGVVGRIDGKRDSDAAIGLRADMDALPIAEETGVSYQSRNPGRMHACGHDGHVAMLLGGARLLAETRDFAGTVYLIFQPGEEEGGGARVMIEEGLFQRYPVREVYGMHNWPGLPVGRFAAVAGPVMAASDRFDLVVRGQGCHGGMPHLGRDPVAAAAQIVNALQTIVSRRANPAEAAVVSVTRMAAGETYNIIPAEAHLAGTLRSLGEDARMWLREQVRGVAEATAAAHGVEAELTIHAGYPTTVNDRNCAQLAESVAAEVSGEAVYTDLAPSMGSEDFAFMLQERPGCYVWLGNGPTDGGRQLHSSRYDFNDAILPVGAAYWHRLVEHRLADGPVR